MKRKIIFLDIDGTLTEGGSNIPPESALKAIRIAQKAGHYVFLCTGRNMNLLSPLLQYGFDGVVASAGGYIEVQGKTIYDCPMTKEQADKSIAVFEKNQFLQLIECKDVTYMKGDFDTAFETTGEEEANSEWMRWAVTLAENLHTKPFDEYKGEPIYKICFLHTKKEQLEEPRRVLSGDFSWVIQRPMGKVRNGELLNRKFNKGTGIKRVCEYLNMPVADSFGFGDSMNDWDMMLAAGTSICMANGDSRLKEIAHDVCPSVTEDGLYKAFEKYHLL